MKTIIILLGLTLLGCSSTEELSYQPTVDDEYADRQDRDKEMLRDTDRF
ncbi:hypothetical protein [Photobacterium frigidiphilum]|nr:hypothetical protein [Photobacterium frigidiphilum]